MAIAGDGPVGLAVAGELVRADAKVVVLKVRPNREDPAQQRIARVALGVQA